ncbi:crotonase/enoyl-CoA hydratase family protein [Shewanella polaris]|uniref:Crotonase/enoyl-CoA hydratase family protein n=1 Tax=Shewanella polaris TaxID=2588449 RepID=A0A4Y5YJ44_9GAMM|nr:crotonase/enoyl-CoA hydratase family protein [Shewanella polaris]QDE32638.1 crotonase/enoyl-CoA hydratase family protein [Shewanella polaris]
METELIKFTVDNGIAHVCLNRPSKINALNVEMFTEIDRVIKQIHVNKHINAVILSGADGNFCSGLDVKSVANSPINALKLLFKWLPGNANLAQRVSLGWQRLPIPVIAVLEGCCYGGGTQIALGADIRIATPSCKLSIMEAKWGLVPDMAGLVALRQIMSKDKALMLTYTADILTAEHALELGLVTEISETAYERATVLAQKIIRTSPDANAAIKRSINQNWTASVRSLLARESLSQVRLLLGKNRVIATIRQTKNPDKAYRSRQSWW